jgi:hypothetical protein
MSWIAIRGEYSVNEVILQLWQGGRIKQKGQAGQDWWIKCFSFEA